MYCGKCHDGPNALVEDFGIKSLDDLKSFKPFMGGSIIERIENGVMPADLSTYSDDRKKDWERDKAVLLQELKQ